jgi:hypothetical protein
MYRYRYAIAITLLLVYFIYTQVVDLIDYFVWLHRPA